MDEFSLEIRLERRTMKGSSSGRIMRLVPVFILETHNPGPLHMSPVDRAGTVTGMNFALGSYEKFQPGFRDEKRSKILGTSSGAKFGKQSKHSETQKFIVFIRTQKLNSDLFNYSCVH